jgi:hypothetical protein
MIPLASICLSVSRGRIRRKAFWFPPVRQTGFLHSAAALSVGLNLRSCPRVIADLSTGISAESFGVANKPQKHRIGGSRDDDQRGRATLSSHYLRERDMPPPRSTKARVNEGKYPFVVELAIKNGQLDFALSRQIMRFHRSRHIRLRYGRAIVGQFGSRYRWCFSDLSTARNFVEDWRRVLEAFI